MRRHKRLAVLAVAAWVVFGLQVATVLAQRI
jgi:hypothetical protein